MFFDVKIMEAAAMAALRNADIVVAVRLGYATPQYEIHERGVLKGSGLTAEQLADWISAFLIRHGLLTVEATTTTKKDEPPCS